MEAKRTALLLNVLLLVGCHRVALPGEGGIEIVFSIQGEETRTIGTDGECAVEDWALLLYKNGRLIEAGTSESGSAITKTLAAGGYTAFAVVNPPTSFDPENYPKLSFLTSEESALRDNSPGRLVMFGSRSFTVPVPNGRTQMIGVDRLVCKAEIQKISVDFTDPLLATRTFILKGIYLTNCYGISRFDEDFEPEEILSNAFAWHNRMGFQTDADINDLLAETDLNAFITSGRPHVQEHSFYYYPNPLPETMDNRSGIWIRRLTRLVIEAEIGERTYYYTITLPVSERNKTYIIEEAVIRKLGSRDPEMEEPGSIDVVFRASVEDWSPEYNVTENS